MPAERQWKTETEILEIVRKESHLWREEIRRHLVKQDEQSGRLIDGAQASLYLATILTGDERYGIQGALPEIKQRLERLEQRAETTEAKVEGYHADHNARFDTLERGQHKIRRGVVWVGKQTEAAQPVWKALVAAATALGIGVSWPGIRRWVMGLLHAK